MECHGVPFWGRPHGANANDKETVMPRNKRFTTGAVLAGVAILGGSLLVAAPANAAEVPFGYLNCTQGSIRTQGNATQAQTHFVTQGGSVFSRSFPSSGSGYATRTWYSGKNISSNGGVQTVGNIAWANQICSD